MKIIKTHSILLALAVSSLPAAAKIITVNTTNNVSPGSNETNLVQAIKLLEDGDTISFNITGTTGQVFYLETPPNGYPIITNNNVTIDGYSQPGAAPNTNPIHAPNNAKIKICLDSRNGNATDMGQIELLGPPDEKYGFGHDEWAVLGVFRGMNVTFKGLGILSAPLNPVGSDENSANAVIKSLAFARDYAGTAENWHVSGCWIGVDPADGQIKYITDGSSYTNIAAPGICIAAYRHRDSAGNNAVYPQPGTIGVSAGSTNARAEFNIIVNGYGFDSEGLNYRISGNFWGVLPDGKTSADFSDLLDGAQMGDGFVEIGRDVSNSIIGTDGDGVNDADEGNVFGGFARGGTMINFYSNPHKNIIIAGNWFGVAIDGTTRFTNTAAIVDGFSGQATAQFGSDFDGVSDGLEGNLVVNNQPFPGVLTDSGSGGLNTEPDALAISVGARISCRGNQFINNSIVPYVFADGNSTRFDNFTNYESFYMDTNTSIIPVLDATNSTFPRLKGTFAVGIAPYTNIMVDVYQLDQEGWNNGKQYAFAELTDQTTYTNGFAQGSKFLGSFTVTNSGNFDLDLSGMDLGLGAVTVTVNYSADQPKTHRGNTHTSNFSNPISLIPGGTASVGLTHIVPDVAVWYSSTGNYVTNGPVDVASQAAPLDNWEPYIGVLGDSTYLIGMNTFADDQTIPPGATYTGPAQRFVVAFQPTTGGPGKIGEHYFTDAGAPYKGVVNLSRENGNPQRVAGDKRHGAVNFIVASEASLGQLTQFQSDTRWTSNLIYQSDNRYVTEQTFSLDPVTLVQTPLHKAWDYVYGPFATSTPPIAGNVPQLSRTGGKPEALDNGNFVVMIDDKTGFSSSAGEVTTFAIISPEGSIVKGPTLVDPRDIWDNIAAYKGGFAIRVHNLLYFYDNGGNLQHTNDINVSSGLSFGTGREDASRIGSDIRSYYVYLAGQTPEVSQGNVPVNVAIWDSRTGEFVTQAGVSDTDPTIAKSDRVAIAVDALDRFCVVYSLQPTPEFTHRQVAARVMAFDGTKITYLTHSFFPFVNYESNPNNVLGYETFHPSVAMTTMNICIAAKGQINSTNSATAGPDTAAQTQIYTMVSHPAPVSPIPQAPRLSVTVSGNNLVISWNADDGVFTLEAASDLTTIRPWPAVTPQPPIVPGPGNTKTMTVPITAGNKYFQLAK